MSYEEIIGTTDTWRVKLVQDEYADEPYDDGQAPLVRIDVNGRRGYPCVEHIQIGARPTADDEWVEEVVRRHWHRSNRWELIEKALKGALGVTRIDHYESRDYKYFAYDSKRWREYCGFAPDDPIKYDMLAEYEAYCEGDVWGYVLEKRVHWTTDEEEVSDRDTWEETDSCWGYYGYDYAAEEARMVLAAQLKEDESKEEGK